MTTYYLYIYIYIYIYIFHLQKKNTGNTGDADEDIIIYYYNDDDGKVKIGSEYDYQISMYTIRKLARASHRIVLILETGENIIAEGATADISNDTSSNEVFQLMDRAPAWFDLAVEEVRYLN